MNAPPRLRCDQCGARLEFSETGRPRKFCSGRCRQKAARARRHLIETLTKIELIALGLQPPVDWSDEEHRVA